MYEEKQALIRHIRRHHPNLLMGAIGWSDWRRALEADRPVSAFGGILPDSGLSEVPMPILLAAHDAAHMGLYFPHMEDDWLCREYEERIRRELEES